MSSSVPRADMQKSVFAEMSLALVGLRPHNIKWLAGRLAGWLGGWLAGWLVGRWLAGRLAGWLQSNGFRFECNFK